MATETTTYNLTSYEKRSLHLFLLETDDIYVLDMQFPSYVYLTLVIAFLLFMIFLQFWKFDWNHELCDVGYDFLWERKSMWTSRAARRQMVQDVRKLRHIGDLPPVYPNGWIALFESNNISKGQVKHIAALGESLAVFRSEKGEIMILDAYCPHLGANLAIGGVVKGDCLQCPFHGWTFDGSTGMCVDIPYSDKALNVAKVKKWFSCEANDFIYVWYHAEGCDPLWQVEEVPQIKSGEWWFRGRNEFIVNSHVEDISENAADTAHLNAIHSQSMLAGSKPGSFNGPQMALTSFFKHKWRAEWTPNELQQHVGLITIEHCVQLFGALELMHIHVDGKQIGPTHVKLQLNTTFGPILVLMEVTPLEPLLQRVVHRFYCPPHLMIYAAIVMYGENVMIKRDIGAWNHKKYKKRPLVTKEETMLQNHRRWYRQFYSEHSPLFTFRRDAIDW
ncbi:cholesterol 7-desaturase nvd [Nilaparvata lugens]|uniref:cholesterol 7-desaturase nvd n=1 Tax=Nilaparvata lugens TaxID=108931 RepID=UPI00193DDB51|nr:cholesterol 7-desaturase nvd [Nilaparvata lugens]XP_039281565.1 cholesterol 7-desaturase nvd [Nilaparvata lugens]